MGRLEVGGDGGPKVGDDDRRWDIE